MYFFCIFFFKGMRGLATWQRKWGSCGVSGKAFQETHKGGWGLARFIWVEIEGCSCVPSPSILPWKSPATTSAKPKQKPCPELVFRTKAWSFGACRQLPSGLRPHPGGNTLTCTQAVNWGLEGLCHREIVPCRWPPGLDQSSKLSCFPFLFFSSATIILL